MLPSLNVPVERNILLWKLYAEDRGLAAASLAETNAIVRDRFINCSPLLLLLSNSTQRKPKQEPSIKSLESEEIQVAKTPRQENTSLFFY